MLTIFKILIILAAISVAKILLEIFNSSKCPPIKDLRNAVLGGSGNQYNQIIKHIGTCQECQDKISQLNDN